MLDNRELASLILMACCAVLVCGKKSTRHAVLKSFRDVLLAALSRPLVPVWAAFAAWSLLAVKLMAKFGLWDSSLLKDTILEVALVGIPAVVNYVNVGSTRVIFRDFVLSELSLGGVLGYYITLEVMSLPVEFLLQVIGLALALLPLLRRKQDSAIVPERIVSALSVAIGVLYISYTTRALVYGCQDHSLASDISVYLLGVWYPAVMVPLIIAIDQFSAYQLMLRRIRGLCGSVPTLALAGLCPAVSPRLAYVRHFNPLLAKEYFGLAEHADRKSFLSDYKRDVLLKVAKERGKDARYRKGEGKAGFDPNGLWLDRTCLGEIKQKLGVVESVLSSDSYIGKSFEKHREFLDMFTPRGCSRGCEEIDDRLVLWMSNQTGFTFAILGRVRESEWLRYEGERPPSADDVRQLRGFVADEEVLPNWAYDDYIDASYL